MAAIVSEKLLSWYDAHARNLPWRALPGEPLPDPYRVWLSEIMLQQTTVAAVKPYFEAFTTRWPTIDDLASAPEEDVMAAWAGLGYYSRARNLAKAARAVVERGSFPDNEAELRALPGLGAYTAAAVAAIAFGRRAVVVDANVERVVARLFAIGQPLPGARKPIRTATDAITPDHRAGDFAQGMMDLGATICTVRDPNCSLCPLERDCRGRAEGDPSLLPVKAPKKAKPVRQGRAFWIERNDAVWLVRREGKGILGGMRGLPDDSWTAGGDGTGVAPLTGDWETIGMVRHTFTHFALELSVKGYLGSALPEGDGEWWPIDQVGEAGLPTLFAKAARLALA